MSHSHRTGEIGTISTVQFSKLMALWQGTISPWQSARGWPEDSCLPAFGRVVCGVASQLSSLLSARCLLACCGQHALFAVHCSLLPRIRDSVSRAMSRQCVLQSFSSAFVFELGRVGRQETICCQEQKRKL